MDSMKLAAIFIVYGECYLINKAIDNISPVVDKVIVIWSNYSNYGVYKQFGCDNERAEFINWEPKPAFAFSVHEKETAKRNFGINQAREQGFSHFIIMDEDEFYKQSDIEKDKNYLLQNSDVNGLVSRIKVLFARPTLWCEDHTLLPTITRLGKDTRVGKFDNYPFAYDSEGHAHIDPTRRVNYTKGIVMSDTVMWHASWIRKDYEQKIENSAARNNLRKSTILEDLSNAIPGYYCKFYRQTLKECENIFNL